MTSQVIRSPLNGYFHLSTPFLYAIGASTNNPDAGQSNFLYRLSYLYIGFFLPCPRKNRVGRIFYSSEVNYWIRICRMYGVASKNVAKWIRTRYVLATSFRSISCSSSVHRREMLFTDTSVRRQSATNDVKRAISRYKIFCYFKTILPRSSVFTRIDTCVLHIRIIACVPGAVSSTKSKIFNKVEISSARRHYSD